MIPASSQSELPMGVIPRVVMAFLAMSCGAHARDLAQLGPLRASAGEAVSGYLEVPALGDNGARIPVSLVRGVGQWAGAGAGRRNSRL